MGALLFASKAELAGQFIAVCSGRALYLPVYAIKQGMIHWTSATSLRAQPTCLCTISTQALTKASRQKRLRPLRAESPNSNRL